MRLWHHYSLWEDHRAGLYRPCPAGGEAVALVLMSDTPRWITAMHDTLAEWPYAAEHNLTHQDHNRIAWLGQASVCYAAALPAAVTKRAWWRLSEFQRADANEGAAAVIDGWVVDQCRESQLELTF